MRILFLTNYYPPYSRGGYEQWCQEVAQALTLRGHQVCVLTTRSGTHQVLNNEHGIQVQRGLWSEVEGSLAQTTLRLLKDRPRLESENLEQVHKLVMEFQPEVSLVWGMWNLPRSLPALIERLLPKRVAYYICDYWLTLPSAYIQRWQAPATKALTQFPKLLLGKYFLSELTKETPIQLKLDNTICVSRAVRDILVEAGLISDHSRVIYGGIIPENYPERNGDGRKLDADGLNLLYIGRLEPEKGVHTAVNALNYLNNLGVHSARLNIYGRGDSTYESRLRSLVKELHLDNSVFFRGAIPHQQVPQVIARHDVLVFPSEWQEPFARTVLEAMAAGLVVVGTTTGGTKEILVDGKTGLTFPAGDAEQLAAQIQRLAQNPGLRNTLADAGQRCVIENYTLSRMVDQLEKNLSDMVSKQRESGSLPEKVYQEKIDLVRGAIEKPENQAITHNQDIYT
jgi:glycogen synthase